MSSYGLSIMHCTNTDAVADTIVYSAPMLVPDPNNPGELIVKYPNN